MPDKPFRILLAGISANLRLTTWQEVDYADLWLAEYAGVNAAAT